MREGLWFGAVVGALCIACSSTSSGGNGSCKIDGVYGVKGTRTQTTCDPKIGADDSAVVDYTFVTRNGVTTVSFPNIANGCEGSVDGCRFTASCDIVDKNGTVALTYGASFVFDDKGFTGSETAGFNPPLVPKPCRASFDSVGTRR